MAHEFQSGPNAVIPIYLSNPPKPLLNPAVSYRHFSRERHINQDRYKERVQCMREK